MPSELNGQCLQNYGVRGDRKFDCVARALRAHPPDLAADLSSLLLVPKAARRICIVLDTVV
eukprot:5151041-Amphidinium_carterae.1